MSLFSVEGKTVIVTGGAHGLGLNYARTLLDHGARVAICDKNPQFLEEAVKTLREAGYAVLAGEVDVTREPEIQDFVDKVEKAYGGIDVLINNAGVLLRRSPEVMTEQEWDFIQNVNVKGTFLFSKTVGSRMIAGKRPGKIINITSQAGVRAGDLRIGYCTSKAAIIHFTKTLALEWGKYGITVNAIGPGYIKTDMNADLRADPEKYAAWQAEIPLGDFGDPEVLNGTLLFLSSAASDYITGQSIFVDGGVTVK